MPTSQNGYPANDPTLVSSRLVPGTTRRLTVRKGPAGDLLLWVASQFDKFVEDIEQGVLDDWGYAERPIRGSTTVLSNHSSGTAIDLNATAHVLGAEPSTSFSRQEIDTIHAVVARTEGCVRWGGDYTGRKDGMHFEIADGVSEARCAAVLKKLTESRPARIEEDMAIVGKAFSPTPERSQEYVAVPCNGLRQLFIAVGASDTVDGIAYFVGDTPPQGGRFVGKNFPFHVDPNRPGPIGVPDDCRVVILGITKATHDFTVWCA